MLTQRSTPRTADEQPPGGWGEIRFWVGTFGMFVTTFVLCLVAVTFLMSLVLGYRPITVVSGSMEPGISAGDIVLYQPHPLSGIEQETVGHRVR
jgi:signal peptidase I